MQSGHNVYSVSLDTPPQLISSSNVDAWCSLLSSNCSGSRVSLTVCASQDFLAVFTFVASHNGSRYCPTDIVYNTDGVGRRPVIVDCQCLCDAVCDPVSSWVYLSSLVRLDGIINIRHRQAGELQQWQRSNFLVTWFMSSYSWRSQPNRDSMASDCSWLSSTYENPNLSIRYDAQSARERSKSDQ